MISSLTRAFCVFRSMLRARPWAWWKVHNTPGVPTLHAPLWTSSMVCPKVEQLLRCLYTRHAFRKMRLECPIALEHVKVRNRLRPCHIGRRLVDRAPAARAETRPSLFCLALSRVKLGAACGSSTQLQKLDVVRNGSSCRRLILRQQAPE